MRTMKLAAMALTLGVAGAANAQTTVYETGFEQPTFFAGLGISGQDGWISTASPLWSVITTSVVNGGAQSAMIDAAQSGGVSQWTWKDVTFDPVGMGTPVVDVTWDMYIASGTIGLAGIDIYSSTPFDRLTFLGVSNTNFVNYWNGVGTTQTTATVTRNAWHSYRISLNFTNNTCAFYFNGSQVATSTIPAGHNFGDADLWMGGANQANTYYDNFKIVAGQGGTVCYPDCDNNGTLNVNDYICFQTKFALGDPYADCDNNGVRNVNDYICFQTKFALGC